MNVNYQAPNQQGKNGQAPLSSAHAAIGKKTAAEIDERSGHIHDKGHTYTQKELKAWEKAHAAGQPFDLGREIK